MKNNILEKIALSKIPNVGPVLARNLVSYCGGVAGVFEASVKELVKIPNIGRTVAETVVGKDYFQAAERELLFLEKHGIEALFFLDEGYPSRLKHFNNSPIILFYRGTTSLNHLKTVAIVGTRTPTAQGRAFCEEIVEGLLKYKPLIVSGLAYGIDVVAHRKSLELGMETIGVLGHGLGRIYPPQHHAIAQEMTQQGGLLTEFGHDVRPDREHFPLRNRIIAALSDVVIVVETAERGGSIITAEFANDYNKDVFAVPGRVKDKYSQGCNKLIKTHKAALIESAEDVAYVMRWHETDAAATKTAMQTQLFTDLTPEQALVVAILRKTEIVGIDQISYEAKLLPSDTAALLLEMEFKGMVRSLPGKRFTLIV